MDCDAKQLLLNKPVTCQHQQYAEFDKIGALKAFAIAMTGVLNN
jgi:hypothetical protein